MSKPDYVVVSFSGGKDSTAMLLRMLEENQKIDCILFCDTGLEFPAMYRHIDLVEKRIGRPITRVSASRSFEYMLLDHKVNRKRSTSFSERFGKNHLGYGWAGPKMRWCTSKLKDGPREKFLAPLRAQYNIIEVVGIAADEEYRMQRVRNQNENHRHPLIEWGMTEEDCLQYCYDRGYTWEGLYQEYKRVSCWCCPLQPLSELRILYKNHPDLWCQLKDWDNRTWRQFRADYSVEDLEVRFVLEAQFLAEGKSIKNKQFFTELRKQLEEKKHES